VAFSTASEEFNTQLERLSRELAELEWKQENRALDSNAAAVAEQRIESLKLQIFLLKKRFEPDLARTLIEIVAEATDFYQMPFNDALMVVQEWQSEGVQLVNMPWDDE